MGAVHPAACERARSWVSLALDDELSQLEQAALRAHLGRCGACAALSLELGALTQGLRAAPLERPAAWLAPRRRRRAARTLQVGASAAAAIALAAGLGSLFGSLSAPPDTTRGTVLPGPIVALTGTHGLRSNVTRPVAL
jgi:predicted anti-sigma-YlaC factor YlaD